MSSVVGIFESVVAVLPIVICFQSLVLDMAGNVGTQSLAVTIRVLVDEDLDTRKKLALLGKENEDRLFEWSEPWRHGTCISWHLHPPVQKICLDVSIPDFRVRWDFSGRCDGNLWFVGTIIPMFFHKIHIDPAVASGPLITTVNDLVAVITYYGLAMVFLIDIFHI